MTRLPLLLLTVILFAGCVAPPVEPDPSTLPPPSSAPAFVDRPGLRIETEEGLLTVVLYPEAAPRTVRLVMDYVNESYYVGREFNRAVPGHVIQVTDKAGGATDDARTVPLETHVDYHFSAGALGIARGAAPDSGGTEFFIMDFATSHLDGNYTVWGQVVQGLHVVHRAARVPAVESPRAPDVPGVDEPPVGVPVMDRMAVDAVAILSMELVTLKLPAEEADALPLVVARNVRQGDYRHSLEWPRNLAPGKEADLTWYVRGYNGTAPPDVGSLSIVLGDKNFLPFEDPDAPGAYHFSWTPRESGEHEATLVSDGKALATLKIKVP